MLKHFTVANQRWTGDDLFVDRPEVFLVMPFAEEWSDQLLRDLSVPAQP
jgi:hypothetical protein